MAEDRTEISEHFTERTEASMSAVAEASRHLRELSEPWRPGESLKSALNRVTKIVNRVAREYGVLRVPMKVSRVEDIWREEARRIDAEEMDAIRLTRRLMKSAQDEKTEKDARDEFSALNKRIEALEAALLLSASDEGRAALAEALQKGRDLDRAVDFIRGPR